MGKLPFFDQNPQYSGPQYLEDLGTAYWFSEALFTAVELELFSMLEPEGMSASALSTALNLHSQSCERFLKALAALGLVTTDGATYHNTKLGSEYLVKGRDGYLGDSILWRKNLQPGWQDLTACLKSGGRVNLPEGDGQEDLSRRIRPYINAMDSVAREKVLEILACFEGMKLEGMLLDVGAGSGAISTGFMQRFPALNSTLLDLPEVLSYSQELLSAKGFEERVNYLPCNILEAWPVPAASFDLVILSNIVHAYSEVEIPEVLARAVQSLKPGGILLIHDFFLEHQPIKAALFDLNMFINTYNGRVFSEAWVREQLSGLKLSCLDLIPLASDTGLIFAAHTEDTLAALSINAQTRLVAAIKTLGFKEVRFIEAENIHVTDWADLRCRFGCNRYGTGHCPPNSPSAAKTRQVLEDYSHALLLEGEPPGRDFQRQVLAAEKAAFVAGFHKAFAYWAGPCEICDTCVTDGVCRNPRDSRPSMEGAGIDVFTTVRQAGFSLRTLPNQGDFVKFFALLLLE